MSRTSEAAAKLLQFLEESRQTAAAPEGPASLFAAPTSNTQTRPIDLDISFVTALRPHRVPLFVTLPHEIHNGTICVVTKPPQRTFKDLVIKAQEEEANPVALRIRKVIDVTKLDAKFKDPVALRALANSFDHFFVYKAAQYPRALAGEFLHHQRPPVWAPKGAFMDSITEATRVAVVPRRGFDNVTVCIGHDGLSAEQLTSNCNAFIELLLKHMDGPTAKDVLQIRLAGTDHKGRRAALPVWTHDYDISHPGVLAAAAATPSKQPRAEVEEPSAKRRRKK